MLESANAEAVCVWTLVRGLDLNPLLVQVGGLGHVQRNMWMDVLMQRSDLWTVCKVSRNAECNCFPGDFGGRKEGLGLLIL